MNTPTAARSAELVTTVLDAESFVSWDEPPVAVPMDAGYRATLEAARLPWTRRC